MVVVLTVATIGGWLLLLPSGHTAAAGPAPATAQGDPVPGPNQARLMRMLHLATAPDRANLPRHRHAPSPKLSARTTATPPGRRQSFATAAFRRSPARLNHRHVPWKHSVPRTLAPQRHAPASQRHAGVQLMLLTADPSRLLRPSADQPTDLAKPPDVSQTGRVDLAPRSRAEPTRVDCLPKQQFP